MFIFKSETSAYNALVSALPDAPEPAADVLAPALAPTAPPVDILDAPVPPTAPPDGLEVGNVLAPVDYLGAPCAAPTLLPPSM